MRMPCLAKRGASARSMAWISALVSVPARLKNTAEARSRASPERSSASMVLAKVGAAALPAMAAISLRLVAKPRSKAGTKCSISMRSNGGIWNGVVQASRSGFFLVGRVSIVLVLTLDFGLARGATLGDFCLALLLAMMDLSAACSLRRAMDRHCAIVEAREARRLGPAKRRSNTGGDRDLRWVIATLDPTYALRVNASAPTYRSSCASCRRRRSARRR